MLIGKLIQQILVLIISVVVRITLVFLLLLYEESRFLAKFEVSFFRYSDFHTNFIFLSGETKKSPEVRKLIRPGATEVYPCCLVKRFDPNDKAFLGFLVFISRCVRSGFCVWVCTPSNSVATKVFGSLKLAKQVLFFFTYIAVLAFNLPKDNSFVDIIFILAILILLVLSARKGTEIGLARQQIVSWLLIIALPFFSAIDSVTAGVNFASFYYQYYAVQDTYTLCLRSFLILCTAIFLLLTLEYLVKYSALNKINLVEFPLIIGFSLFFILSMLSSFNLFGAYISIEGLTFTLYILAGTNYNSQNCLESGLKYFCLGALSSGFLLLGTALIFIMTGTLDFADLRFIFGSLEELPLLLSFSLIFLVFGFWFKLSIFPCHAWTPDVYEGVLTPVTFFFATVVKVGVFGLLVRVLFFLLGTNVFFFFENPSFYLPQRVLLFLGLLGL